MKLTDMKRSKKERKASGMNACKTYEGDAYGYGLCIRLDGEDMEKLGIDASDFKVGQVVRIEASAKVKSMSSNVGEGRDPHQSLEFQVTSMGVGKGGPKSMAEAVADGVEKGS